MYIVSSCSCLCARDSPTMWPLCALFFILLQFYVPFYVKKEKIDNLMCLLEFECAKRLKAHSRAIPVAQSIETRYSAILVHNGVRLILEVWQYIYIYGKGKSHKSPKWYQLTENQLFMKIITTCPGYPSYQGSLLLTWINFNPSMDE